MLASKLQILFNILLYLFILLLLFQRIKIKNGRYNIIFSLLGILVFCVFSYWGGDYFHYYFSYDNSFIDTHIEPIYIFLAKNSPTYSVWRFYIWGVALIMVTKLLNKYNNSKFIIFIIFVSISLLDFSYGRASLSMAFLFAGYYLISIRKKTLLGFALLFCSFFFHRSAAFGIVLFFLAYIFPIKRARTLLLYAIIFIFAYFSLSDFIGSFLGYDVDYDDAMGQVVSRGQRYLEREERESGIGGLCRDVLDKIPIYLSFLLFVKIVSKKYIKNYPKDILLFSNVSFIMILIASLLAYNTVYQTQVMYERFLQFSLIPTVIFLSYSYNNNIYRKYIRIIIIMGILSSIYTLLYAYHCAK